MDGELGATFQTLRTLVGAAPGGCAFADLKEALAAEYFTGARLQLHVLCSLVLAGVVSIDHVRLADAAITSGDDDATTATARRLMTQYHAWREERALPPLT